MLKKTITYPDLDGNKVSEDFYFNLNKAEIAEMELSHKGGFSSYLQTIVDSQDGAEIIAAFKSVILAALGRRSDDGKRFIKSEEIRQDFLNSEAYSELFMEFVQNGEAAAQFITAIMPADMAENMPKQVPEKAKDDTPAYILENREPTQEEFAKMSKEEMQAAFLRKTKSD